MTNQTVYLNGQYLPIEQASVSVLDRGFLFGDGVYEVVPVYGGRPFCWPEHRARLIRNLAAIGITDPLDDSGWKTLIDTLLGHHDWPDQFIYLQVSRGVARRDHAFPAGIAPTVFAMSNELTPPSAALRARGISLLSLPDERWLHCDIKSISLLGNVLARQAAVDQHADECAMFRDGFLTEGSASNIWVVRHNTLLGVPSDHLVLEGIRVGLIETLCADEGIKFERRRIHRDELALADELLVSSATKEVLAATRLDGRPVGSGRPGPIAERLHAAYQRAKAA